MIKKMVSILLVFTLFAAIISFNGLVSAAGTVKVGDTNFDGDLNIHDVVYLSRMSVGKETPIDDENKWVYVADLTLDGEIRADDIVKLVRCLAGKDVLPEKPPFNDDNINVTDGRKPYDNDGEWMFGWGDQAGSNSGIDNDYD